MDYIPASALMQNDRVIVDKGEMPYLVDRVTEMSNGDVQVFYSSGDTVTYSHDQEVLVK